MRDGDKVQLIDNPIDWSVERLVEFIKTTDCHHLADLLIEHVSVSQSPQHLPLAVLSISMPLLTVYVEMMTVTGNSVAGDRWAGVYDACLAYSAGRTGAEVGSCP